MPICLMNLPFLKFLQRFSQKKRNSKLGKGTTPNFTVAYPPRPVKSLASLDKSSKEVASQKICGKKIKRTGTTV